MRSANLGMLQVEACPTLNEGEESARGKTLNPNKRMPRDPGVRYAVKSPNYHTTVLGVT